MLGEKCNFLFITFFSISLSFLEILLLSIFILFYYITDFLPFLFFLHVKAINNKSHLKARTTEETLQPKDCAWKISPSTGQVWWPGEKTRDANELPEPPTTYSPLNISFFPKDQTLGLVWTHLTASGFKLSGFCNKPGAWS